MRLFSTSSLAPSARRPGRSVGRGLGLLLLLLGGLIGLTTAPSMAAPSAGAGLIVRHGDGRLIVSYITFETPRLNGIELLRRAGLRLVTMPTAMGEAICSINGEGCPADNCFCQSYGAATRYWRYYHRNQEGWRLASAGASRRQLADGDIDGWEWSAEPSRLPDLTIEQIAARAGVVRQPAVTATPTARPPSTSTPVPPAATALPTSTSPTAITSSPPAAVPATATVGRPPASPVLPATARPLLGATVTPTTERPVTPTSLPSPLPSPATATPARPSDGPSIVVVGSPAPPLATASIAAASPMPPEGPVPLTATTAARTVVVAPDGQTAPLTTPEPAPVPWLGYLTVGLIGILLIGYSALRRRRR